jgi:hypothetical protein
MVGVGWPNVGSQHSVTSRLASHYAERMVDLLTPFSNPGTARYHVIEHRRRDDFITSRPDGADARLWLQLSE